MGLQKAAKEYAEADRKHAALESRFRELSEEMERVRFELNEVGQVRIKKQQALLAATHDVSN